MQPASHVHAPSSRASESPSQAEPGASAANAMLSASLAMQGSGSPSAAQLSRHSLRDWPNGPLLTKDSPASSWQKQRGSQ